MTIEHSMPSAPSSMTLDDFLDALKRLRRHLELAEALSEYGDQLEHIYAEIKEAGIESGYLWAIDPYLLHADPWDMSSPIKLIWRITEHEGKRIFVVFYPKRTGQEEPFPRQRPEIENDLAWETDYTARARRANWDLPSCDPVV